MTTKQFFSDVAVGCLFAVIFFLMTVVRDDETGGFVPKSVAQKHIQKKVQETEYPETNIKTSLLDWRWKLNGKWYDLTEIRKVVPAIKKRDVHRFKCEVLCVNNKGLVVGYNPYVYN